MTDKVQRFDAGRTGKVTRTPQGGVRVDAGLTRVGVFTYRDSEGTRKEYRPPEEVLHADSLASLEGAPVTVDHQGMIGPDTWAQHARGHVLGAPRADGGMVEATLFVQDASAAADVVAKRLREVSCGYQCRLDTTPGVTPEGEHYDAVQRDIRYNHVALGPVGWARQGRDVALRLDSRAATMINVEAAPDADQETPVMKIRIDGTDYEVGSKEHLDSVDSKVKALSESVASEKARADRAEGERDSAQAEIAALKAKCEKFDSEIVSRVDAHVKLREDARKVLGKDATLPATEREILEAVVKHDAADVNLEGKSEDYVRARFDAAVERVSKPGHTPKDARVSDFRKTTDREDAKDSKDEDKRDPREKMIDRHKNAYKSPLAASADDKN